MAYCILKGKIERERERESVRVYRFEAMDWEDDCRGCAESVLCCLVARKLCVQLKSNEYKR